MKTSITAIFQVSSPLRRGQNSFSYGMQQMVQVFIHTAIISIVNSFLQGTLKQGLFLCIAVLSLNPSWPYDCNVADTEIHSEN